METEDYVGIGILGLMAYTLYKVNTSVNSIFETTPPSVGQQVVDAQRTSSAINSSPDAVSQGLTSAPSQLSPGYIVIKDEPSNTTYKVNPDTELNWYQKKQLEAGNFYPDRSGNLVFAALPDLSKAIDRVTARDLPQTTIQKVLSAFPVGIATNLIMGKNTPFANTAAAQTTNKYTFTPPTTGTYIGKGQPLSFTPQQANLYLQSPKSTPSNSAFSIAAKVVNTIPTPTTALSPRAASVSSSKSIPVSGLKVGSTGTNSFGTWSVKSTGKSGKY